MRTYLSGNYRDITISCFSSKTKGLKNKIKKISLFIFLFYIKLEFKMHLFKLIKVINKTIIFKIYFNLIYFEFHEFH